MTWSEVGTRPTRLLPVLGDALLTCIIVLIVFALHGLAVLGRPRWKSFNLREQVLGGGEGHGIGWRMAHADSMTLQMDRINSIIRIEKYSVSMTGDYSLLD